MDVGLNGWACGYAGGWMDGRVDGWAVRCVGGMRGLVNVRVDVRVDVWAGGWLIGLVDGQFVGLLDEWFGVRMVGWLSGTVVDGWEVYWIGR